jgi:hypothetical protein
MEPAGELGSGRGLRRSQGPGPPVRCQVPQEQREQCPKKPGKRLRKGSGWRRALRLDFLGCHWRL